jgi:S-adenosylmethionine hydrolase
MKILEIKEYQAFIRPDNGSSETYAMQIQKLAEKINEIIEKLNENK